MKDSPSLTTWQQKLERLQRILEDAARDRSGPEANKGPALVAEKLGITTRTLSDLMKPEARDPKGPLKVLIDLLLQEQPEDQSVSPELLGEPLLNLVIIHEEWRPARAADPVDAILELHRTGGSNNEFHLISVSPVLESSWMKWAREGLMKRQVQPHFFDCPRQYDDVAARDCFFTAKAMMLTGKSMRRGLAHITLAAEVDRFWVLARELKDFAAVDVTVVRDGAPGDDREMDHLLRSLGIHSAYPFSGRRSGIVRRLMSDARGKIAYGFIRDTTPSIAQSAEPEGKDLFFSYNHMRRGESGHPECEISNLREGDEVSFSIGVNHRGRCAVDVALEAHLEAAH